jgi:heterodisulfide reductase subunit B
LVRPADIAGFDDAEEPMAMDLAVKASGAVPVTWRRKVDCCGGGFSLSRTASVIRLGRAVIDDAAKAGAEAIAVACPMCHSNLDFRQKAMARADENLSPMPIVYITQLVGLSMGIAPEALGLKRHFVDTKSLCRALAKVAEAPASASGGA